MSDILKMLEMFERNHEFAPAAQRDLDEIINALRAAPAQKVQDYKCIDDGGVCGVGGYCEKCPHTKHERIAAAQAQEGKP